VTGTISNLGNGTANNIVMHIYASQSGGITAIDTNSTLPAIAAGESHEVDLSFAYTGEALQVFTNPTLDWTN
jgi:hypothetical protein